MQNIFTSDPLKTGNTFQTCFTPLNHHETTYHCVLKDLQVIICLGWRKHGFSVCSVCINRGGGMIEMLVCRLFRFNHRLTAIKKAEVTTSTDTLIPWYLDIRIVQNTSPTLIWVLIVSKACFLFVGNLRSPLSTQRPLERHMNMKCDVMMTRVMLKVAVYTGYTGCWCHAEGAVCVYSPACGGCSGLLGDLSSVTQPPAAAPDTWT